MTVKIYTRAFCSYCVSAKRLLDQLGVPYQEIAVERDSEEHKTMMRESGQRTFPQIWINNQHIGGCDELFALHRSNQLMPLLAKSGD